MIAACEARPKGRDDVLARCLALQAKGEPGFSDAQIRTALMGFIVGGPPQPPMVVPQAMEQLLRRPEALAGAQAAARANDDALLAGYVREAMRFDPLAPGLPRITLKDWTIAEGTRTRARCPAGATVFAAFASAMMDDRRVPDPERFDPHRLPHEYIHFGHDAARVLRHPYQPRDLAPDAEAAAQAGPNLRRAPGSAGKLRKSGAFAESLTVEFD
jgi:cytochrome P450